jgi:hypothetical protein
MGEDWMVSDVPPEWEGRWHYLKTPTVMSALA